MSTYLIVRVSMTPGGKDTAALLWLRQPLGEPRPDVVRRLCAEHGWDAEPHIGVYDVAAWPGTAVAYTSRNKEGRGRSGSSLQTWRARPHSTAWRCVPVALYGFGYRSPRWTCRHGLYGEPGEKPETCGSWHFSEMAALSHARFLNRQEKKR